MNTHENMDQQSWKPGRRELLTHLGRLGLGAAGLGLLSGCPDAQVMQNPGPRQPAVPDTSSAPEELRMGIDRIAEGYAVDFRAGKYRGYLHRSAGDVWIALSSRCTHAGCIVSFQRDIQGYKCPCHGSAYDSQGRPLRGPAKRPLQRFQTRVEGDVVYVVFKDYVADEEQAPAQQIPAPAEQQDSRPSGIPHFGGEEIEGPR